MGTGIGIGLAVAAMNGLAAWLLLRWAFTREVRLFVPLFFGGMVGRLLLTGALSLILLLFTPIHRLAYAGSLLVGYLIFLAAEVGYIQYMFKKKKTCEGEPGQRKEGKRPPEQG
jgi:hypothetical protein